MDERDNNPFAIFTYACDELEWAGLPRGSPTIGFYAGDTQQFGVSMLSGFQNPADIACINCPESAWSNVAIMLPHGNPGSGITNTFVFT